MERQVFILQSIKQLLTALSGQRERERVCVHVIRECVCVSDKGQWAALSSGDKRPEMKSEDWKDAGPPQELRAREKREEKRKCLQEKKRENAQACERKEMRGEKTVSGTCGEFHSFSKVYWTEGPEASCWVDLDKTTATWISLNPNNNKLSYRIEYLHFYKMIY